MSILNRKRLLATVALTSLMACGPAQSEDSSKQKAEQKATEQRNAQAEEEKAREPVPPEAQNNNPGQIADASEIDIKKVSEALGHFIGRNINAPGMKFDTDSIIKGIKEGAAGQPSPMTDEEYQMAMAQLQQKALNKLAETNLSAANKFMKDNLSEKGVVELVPGKLQYMILEKGHGPLVQEHGTPLINYTGKYIDGTVFGSSENAGGPVTVPIDQTIPGFSKGIAGMQEGEKRRLFVHPELGYGRSGQLQPDALLIFDIEVVKATSPEKDEVEESDNVTDADDERDLDDDLDSDADDEETEKKEEAPKKEVVPAPEKKDAAPVPENKKGTAPTSTTTTPATKKEAAAVADNNKVDSNKDKETITQPATAPSTTPAGTGPVESKDNKDAKDLKDTK